MKQHVALISRVFQWAYNWKGVFQECIKMLWNTYAENVNKLVSVVTLCDILLCSFLETSETALVRACEWSILFSCFLQLQYYLRIFIDGQQIVFSSITGVLYSEGLISWLYVFVSRQIFLKPNFTVYLHDCRHMELINNYIVCNCHAK